MSELLYVKPKSETDKHKYLRRIAILGGLGVAAYLSKSMDYSNYQSEIGATVDSLAHPMIGYVGALGTVGIGYMLNRKKINNKVLFAGVSAANLLAEVGQDATYRKNPIHEGFLSNAQQFESLKDYAFALVGMGLYMATEKRLRSKV